MGCCKSMVARERAAGYMHGTGTEFCGWAVLAFCFCWVLTFHIIGESRLNDIPHSFLDFVPFFTHIYLLYCT